VVHGLVFCGSPQQRWEAHERCEKFSSPLVVLTKKWLVAGQFFLKFSNYFVI
jgi:hypothetical protein